MMKNIGAIVFLLLVVAASAASGQEKIQFPVGASSKTLGYSPLWVAAKQHFFDQQGLDGQVILLRGTPQAVQALIAGSLYVASGGPESFVEVSERGVDTALIGGIINGLSHFIIGGKKYKSYEDLRGASLGASSLTGGTVTALKHVLKVKGLEYPRDYNILVIAGGSSANLAALASGQIAATTVAVPLNFVAEEAGYNVIGRLVDVIPHYEQTAMAVKRSWAEKNRPLVVRFMKAMVQAHRWLYSNKEAAVDFLVKEMKLKPDYARKGWEYYTENHIWDPDGDVTLDGLKYNLQFYAEQTQSKTPLAAAKYVDQSYLKEALKQLAAK